MSKHVTAPPPLDAATINYMETLYPERSPNPVDSDREIWMKAGERRATLHLKGLLTKQETQNVRF